MATGERQSAGFPVDSGFATARQSRERTSAQRESTEVDIKQSNKKRIYNFNNLSTLLESRNAATNFVTGRVSIENVN
jgi:hypothetical protein